MFTKNRLTLILMLLVMQSRLVYGMESDVVQAKVARAHLDLGMILIRGEGLEQDYTKAREHFLLAAHQVHDPVVRAWANIRLAMLYHLGWGVEKDQQMVDWYCDSVSQLAPDLQESELVELAQILRQQSFDLEARDTRSRTPLMCAASEGRRDKLELLLAKGANVKAVDRYGATALHYAAVAPKASVSCKAIVELLVAYGIDVNARAEIRIPILHHAADSGDRELVEFLLANGADADMEFTMAKPWEWARDKEIKYLLLINTKNRGFGGLYFLKKYIKKKYGV